MKTNLVILILTLSSISLAANYTLPIVSGPATWVYGSTLFYGGPAVQCYTGNTAWVSDEKFGGGKWIWDSYYVQNPRVNEYAHFVHEFNIPGVVIQATLNIASDDDMWLKMNTIRLNQFPTSCSNPVILDATRYLTTGDNVLYVTVLNIAGS